MCMEVFYAVLLILLAVVLSGADVISSLFRSLERTRSRYLQLSSWMYALIVGDFESAGSILSGVLRGG